MPSVGLRGSVLPRTGWGWTTTAFGSPSCSCMGQDPKCRVLYYFSMSLSPPIHSCYQMWAVLALLISGPVFFLGACSFQQPGFFQQGARKHRRWQHPLPELPNFQSLLNSRWVWLKNWQPKILSSIIIYCIRIFCLNIITRSISTILGQIGRTQKSNCEHLFPYSSVDGL